MLVFNLPWLVGGLLSSSLLLIEGGHSFGEHESGVWTHWGNFGNNNTQKEASSNVIAIHNKAFGLTPSPPIFGSTGELRSAASTDVKQYQHHQESPQKVYRDSKGASLQSKRRESHSAQEESNKGYQERKVENDRLLNYRRNQAVAKNQTPQRENIFNTRNKNKNRFKQKNRLRDYHDLAERQNRDQVKTSPPLYDYVISSVTQENQEKITDGAYIEKKREYQHPGSFFQNLENDQRKMVPQNYDRRDHSAQFEPLLIDKISDTRPKLRTGKNARNKEKDQSGEVWEKIHTSLDNMSRWQDERAPHPVLSLNKPHDVIIKSELDPVRVDRNSNNGNNGRDSQASHSQYREKHAKQSPAYESSKDHQKYQEKSDVPQEQVSLHIPHYHSRVEKQAVHDRLHDLEERSEVETDNHSSQVKPRHHETRYNPYQYILQQGTSQISPERSVGLNSKHRAFDPEGEKIIRLQTRKSEDQHQVSKYKPKYHILHEDKYNENEKRRKNTEKLARYEHHKPTIQSKSSKSLSNPTYHLINLKPTESPRDYIKDDHLKVKPSDKNSHQTLNPIFQVHHHRDYSSSKHHPVGLSKPKYPTKNYQKDPKLAVHEHHQHHMVIHPEFSNNDEKQIIFKVKYDDLFKNNGAKQHIHLHHHHHHHHFTNPNKRRSHFSNNDLKGQYTHVHALKHRMNDMSSNMADKRSQILLENSPLIATQTDSPMEMSTHRNIGQTIGPLNGQTYLAVGKRRRSDQNALEPDQGWLETNGKHQNSSRQKYYLSGNNQQSANMNRESNARKIKMNKMHEHPVQNISLVSSKKEENFVNMKTFRSGNIVLGDKRLTSYNNSPRISKHSWTSTINSKSQKPPIQINQTNINQGSHRQQTLKQDGTSIMDNSLWFKRLKQPETTETAQPKGEFKDSQVTYEGSSSTQINTQVQGGLAKDPYPLLHRNKNTEPPFFPELKYNQYVKPTEKPVLLYLIGQ